MGKHDVGPPFVQPARIPQGFALSVWAVLHNRARDPHWRVLDEAYASDRRRTFRWLQAIYKANGSSWSKAEEGWWKTQFSVSIRERGSGNEEVRCSELG